VIVPRAELRVVLAALACWAAPLAAQESRADTVPGIRFRLRVDSLTLRPAPAIQPGGRLGMRLPAPVVGAMWERAVRERLEVDRARRRAFGATLFAAAPTPTAPPPPPPFALRPTPEEERPATLEALSRYADLGLQLRARFETKLDKLTNRRCTAADAQNPISGCQGGFPTPALDQQFNVLAGGVVGNRVHVNLDYDSEREFSANNNINVYYQGQEDEILQRIDVGNVSFLAAPSRFITAAVPANSFGVQAQAQLGAFAFSTILAQQKGSQLRSRFYTVGERTTQPVDREIRDLDYESGRFFFVVNPVGLPGFPDLDILSLSPEVAPPESRPVAVRVYRLRAQSAQNVTNPNLGGIDAVAVRVDGTQRVGPFPWELLIESEDYYLDPSALWFALGNRVGDQDFLAVSYVTASGDTVGTFPALNRGGGDTLELIYEPRRGPEVPTFPYEMRSVYRMGSGLDVDRSSLEVTLAVNESERPLDGQGTYLSRLGLALPADESRVDEFNRVFPRSRDPNNGAPIQDLFLVFPHARPFADSARLQPEERNDSLYRTPQYLLNSQGPPPRFRFQLHYEALGGGDRGVLSLGAFQIRESSEKLMVGQTQLVRGRDYEIDYAVGVVTFLNPDSLFRAPTQIQAQFEENQSFDIAPKSLIGLSTTYDLGSRGRISAIAIRQSESSLLTRPQLGFEPRSNFLGGLSAELNFRPDLLTRALDALPLIETAVPSNLTLNGEVAISQPNPNEAGAAYLEEFEEASARPVSLLESNWQLGSRPFSGLGLPLTHQAPFGGFADADAVPLVWQNLVVTGNDVYRRFPEQIDPTLLFVGATTEAETLLWLSLKPDTIGGAPHPLNGLPRWLRPHTPGPRWRSITQPLGAGGLGLDLTRVEFLEFWVLEDADRRARAANVVLLLDFGTVFEDAVAFGPSTMQTAGGDTVFSGFQDIGIGVLDTERDTLTNVFNAARDDLGIHGDLLPAVLDATSGGGVEGLPTCSRDFTAYPLGDLASTCTRRNGLPDTEDLNGDSRLDVTVGATEENVVRYVFPVGDDRFFVREGGVDTNAAGGRLVWRLYRLPFRTDTITIGAPNLRQIQSIRLTMVAPDQGAEERELFIALARMRLVGAPWLKRAPTPIAGISGSDGLPHGEVVASVATTENRDLGYTPPPGVVNQADRRGAGFEFGAQQVNEKSLRLLARDLRGGERAEAFIRFTDEADKNFLRYSRMRVWARGRGPGWEDGDLEFFIKAGRDEHNFYLYRTGVRSVAWEPEVVIDLDRWLALRARVQTAWLQGAPPSGAAECGGDSTAFVACDGPYLVQVRDPAVSPPNLARVSELAVGIMRPRQTVFVEQAELWVDDIRLTDVVGDMGVAGAIDARLQAADVGEFTFGFTSRDGRFQQLSEEPSYVSDAALQVGGTFRLDRLLPGNHFSIPVRVQYTRTGADPIFLNRSDVRADAVPGLRRPLSSSTTYAIAYRRISKGSGFLARNLVDPFAFQGSTSRGHTVTELSEATVSNTQARLDYNNVPSAATIPATPGFVRAAVGALPGFVRNSEFGRALRDARLRVTPAQLRGALTFVNSQADRLAYRAPVAVPGDSALSRLSGLTRTLRGDAAIDLRPFQTLGLRSDLISTRDLRDYGDSSSVTRLLGRERRSLAGLNMGFERQRLFSTAINLSPPVASWLRPRLTFSSSYQFNRDPNTRAPVRVEGDTAGGFRAPSTISNSRRREIGGTLTPERLVGSVAGDSSFVTRLFRRILPIDVSWQRDRRSSFDRPPFDASLGFQLGLGSLEDFRFRNGLAATSAAETRALTAAGGLLMPFGMAIRSSYRDQRTNTWSRRLGSNEQAEVAQRSREWPSLNLSWSLNVGRALGGVVSLINANGRLTETLTQSRAGGQGPVGGSFTETRTRTTAPSVTVTWGGGIITTLQLGNTNSEQITSGNLTRRSQRDVGATANFSFRPPRSLVRLPNVIRSTLSFNRSSTDICLIQAETVECAPVANTRRSALDIRMDTGFSSQLRGGLSFNYVVTEQRHLSSELAQMIFTVFAEIFFVSGQIR
jgi:hypothetical protein